MLPGGATTPPWVSNGYRPKFLLRNSIASPVRSTLAFAAPSDGPRSAAYAVSIGCPPAPVLVLSAYLPMARNARYVAIGFRLRYVQRVQPAVVLSSTTSPLLTTVVPSGTATDMS